MQDASRLTVKCQESLKKILPPGSLKICNAQSCNDLNFLCTVYGKELRGFAYEQELNTVT